MKKGNPIHLCTLRRFTINSSAIFNHAVRYYNLRDNPLQKAGSMGKRKTER